MVLGENVSKDAQGADGLPDANTVRWTARRKMAVLRAAAAGEISAEEIARRYAISPEELDTWFCDYAERRLSASAKTAGWRGAAGLRSAAEVTRRVAGVRLRLARLRVRRSPPRF